MFKKILKFIGVGLLLIAVVITGLLAWPLPDIPRSGVAGNYLIKNVEIVDVEAGEVNAGQDVLVRGDRISSIRMNLHIFMAGDFKPATAPAVC